MLDYETRQQLRLERDVRLRDRLGLNQARPPFSTCNRCGCPSDCKTPGCKGCWERFNRGRQVTAATRHGSYSGYGEGCRCQACRSFIREAKRASRARQRAQAA